MKFLNYQFLAFLLIFTPFFLHAEKPPIKLGDVSNEELKMEQYDLDPEAEAVILCDYGYRTWTFNTGEGEWKHELNRICRIKIFNDDGYDWATESVALYDNGDIKEDLFKLKGYTYNLENGKVVKTKLDKDNIFEEKTSDSYKRVKFTMPNVKEGSVIEFQYSISSNYHIILDSWYFQYPIPVKHSEYILSIPEYFRYVQNSTGFEKFALYETNTTPGRISWMTTTRPDVSLRGTTGGSVSSGNINYINNIHHYLAKHMPALKDEVFVGNSDNYLQSVGYQLAQFSWFDDKVQNILGNWSDINKKFLNDYEDFGPNMRARNFYKDITNPIIEKYSSPPQRIAAVYNFVSNYMKWNDKNGYIPSQNLRKAFDERTGTAADINALLVSMLRAVEIDADPVILSTISNGLVHPVYPIMNKYNYMIARATVGDQYILLDATEKNMPFGLLPTRCLNQRGYTISETKPGWVDLVPQKGYDRTAMCVVSLDEEGKLSGSVSYKYDGYSGLDLREKLRNNGEEKVVENFASAHPDWSIKKMDFEGEEEIGEPVKEIIELDINGKGEAMGDMIYIDPILTGKIEENPFKQEERKLPIEFIIPIKNSYMLNLEIPEGYTVDELPAPMNIITSDKSAHFKFVAQAMGNRIQIINSWSVDKTFFSPDSFKELKEFYALLVSKHNEQIVLKKGVVNQ